jgi:cell division protein FtsW (lipid II flippase)
MSPRTRELFGLVPVSLLVTAGFTAVLITRSHDTGTATLTYGAVFLAACVLGHIFIRVRLPDADPYLFPLAALIAGFGLVMLYRIDTSFAIKQATWFGVGLALFCLVIVFLRDYRTLERYRYTIASISLGLLLLPRVPGIGGATNGAYLSINVGPLSFQPAEFAKIGIIIFLASYLNDTRDVLVRGRLPVLSLKHFGPLLAIWGMSMLMLVFIRDLGSSLMFFGAFLMLLYVATNRLSLIAGGLAMFLGGAYVLGTHISHVHDRVEAWLHPFQSIELYNRPSGGSYQIAQSLFAQADGGIFGQGLGEALLKVGDSGGTIIPAVQTDAIYALIVNELGLFGGAGLLAAYLIFTYRGFKTAMVAADGFVKLLATGLSAVLALQVFVIVGGVTKVIPLTGVTLPFVSAGGSSVLANFVLLALLLIASDAARRDPDAQQRGGLA